MTTLPRAATSPELVKLRSDNQSSRVYLSVQAPATIFTARLASLPTSNDNVSSIAYNTGSGAAYTDILLEMTLYVGTSAGAYDLGMCRIRSLSGLGATTGTFNIGLTSEITWAANAYLTVIDAFDFFPRVPFGDNMDYNVAYTNQHSHCASIPVLGGRYKIKWLPAGGTVTAVFDGTQSWPLNNTITGYQWTAPGQSAISGDSTSVCTITYNAVNAHAGYRVQLDLTNSDNVDSTGYGRVFVLASESDAITNFSIDNCEGNFQDGGWSAQITMHAEADRATIRDRALCIIHRRDWYGPHSTDEGSIGYVTGDENIELVGWIAGESIKWTPDGQGGTVTFTIQGPHYWLNKLLVPAAGLKNISSHPPTNWKRFTGLTAKSATWHILYWRTNAPSLIDCFPIASSVGALQLQSGGAQTVWEQISNILNDFIIARPTCDAYARLHMQIEQNCLSSSARSSIPTVMTIVKGDWENEIDFDRREVNDIAIVDLNGEIYNGSTTTPVYTLSPGRTFARLGSGSFTRGRLAVLDQASINALASAAFGWQNNPYPNWRFQFPANNHLIDIAPYQYIAIAIASGDTLRGFTESNLRLIPRVIRRIYQNGFIRTEVDIEADSAIGIGQTGDTPPAPPAIPPSPPPVVPPVVPPVPIPPGNAREKWLGASSTQIVWAGDYFNGGQPTWTLALGLPSLSNISWFGISSSGGVAYLCVDGGSGSDAIYMSTTPKTGGWTQILAYGATLGSGRTAKSFGQFKITGTTLSTSFQAIENNHSYRGVYNGSWTFTEISNFGVEHGAMLATSYVADSTADTTAYHRNSGGGVISSWAKDFTAENEGAAWQNNIGGTRYFGASQSTIVKLINGETGAVAYNTGLAEGSGTEFIYISGAIEGPHVYFVTPSTGRLILSNDGSSFSNPFTWAAGIVFDAQRTGGGSLSWNLLSASTGNEFDRISLDRGVTWSAMTGNIWSIISGFSFRGGGLVYA